MDHEFFFHTGMPPRTDVEVKKIAALFVETGGCYFGLPGVDPWDEARDARRYTGPHPVVAHPPCQRWGKMYFGQPRAVKLTGKRKRKGEDGGCFAVSLHAARIYGGVIEHPRGSYAWKWFGLSEPPDEGGWIKADDHGGWTCCVEQGRYGHYARKGTWIYVCGVNREDLPELEWGLSKWEPDEKTVARMGLERAKRLGDVGARGGGRDSSIRIASPPAFRDLLLRIAASTNLCVAPRVDNDDNK